MCLVKLEELAIQGLGFGLLKEQDTRGRMVHSRGPTRNIQSGYFLMNTFAIGGMSGSPIINPANNLVVGIQSTLLLTTGEARAIRIDQSWIDQIALVRGQLQWWG